MAPGSGDRPPDTPGFGPGSPGYGPGQPPPSGPQSPAPGQPPSGPQSPEPPSQRPSVPPPAYPPRPETPGAPPYAGPVPPGGWQQAPPSAGGPPLGELASWGIRLGAFVIDFLVLLVPAVILFFVFVGGAVGLTGTDNEDVAVGAAIVALLGWLLLVVVMWLLYAPPLMARKGERNGQTWGKQLVGIRAVRDSGEPWGFGSAAFREVVLKNLAVFIASTIIPIIPWFLNFFWPLWDDQNRALHDMAASSHVVRA